MTDAPMHVDGFCPSCNQQRLAIIAGTGGIIKCVNPDCPRPLMLANLIDHPDQGHVLSINHGGWLLRHPLAERYEDAMETCWGSEWATTSGAGFEYLPPGQYRIEQHPDGVPRIVALGVIQ